MAEFNEHVLEEAGHRGDKLLVDDLVLLIERHDGDDAPGVTIDRVEAYAEQLAAEDAPVEPDKVRSAIEERRTDSFRWTADATTSGAWFGSGTLYDVGDGRVSVFPAYWHEELTGETELTHYLELVLADLGESDDAFDSGGAASGVPETVLVNAALVLGGLTPRQTQDRLAELRDQGVVTETADQHPNARIRLADRSGEDNNR